MKDCKGHLKQLFAQTDKKFREDEIIKLPEKWQKVVEQNSEYIVRQFLVKMGKKKKKGDFPWWPSG